MRSTFTRILFLLLAIVFLSLKTTYGRNTDSLTKIIEKTKNDTIKINLYNQLAFEYRNNNPTHAKKLLDTAINLAKKKNYASGLYDAYSIIGIIEKNNGNFNLALESNFKALKYADKVSNFHKKSSLFNNIGSIYQSIGNLGLALKYFKMSLEFENKQGNKANQSIRLYNIGSVYEMMDSLILASDFYFHSLKIEEEFVNKEGIFYSLTGLTGVYSRLQKFEMATEFINRAYSIANELGNPMLRVIASIEKGKLLKQQNKFKEAISNFEKAYELADSLGFKNERRVLLEQLSLIYKENQDYKNAYYYQTRFLSVNDSINNAEVQTKIADLQTKYEVEKKDNDLNQLRNLQTLQSEELNHKKRVIYYFVILCIAVLLLIYIKLYHIKTESEVNNSFSKVSKRIFSDVPDNKIRLIISILSSIVYFTFSLFVTTYYSSSNYASQYLYHIPTLFFVFVPVYYSFNFYNIVNSKFNYPKTKFLSITILPLANILAISILIWLYNSIIGAYSYNIEEFFNCMAELILVFMLPFIVVLFTYDSYLNSAYTERAIVLSEKIEESISAPKPVIKKAFSISTENGKHNFSIDEELVHYIKADDNYCEVISFSGGKAKKELMRITLKNVEEQIKDFPMFIRCHKSYIVNISNIEKISGNSLGYKLHVKNVGAEIPVSRNFPKEILERIKSTIG